MPDERLNLAAYRRQLEDEQTLVRCIHCKKVISATATRCPECGVHFDGEASDFANPAERARQRKQKARFIGIIAIIVILALVLSLIF